MEFSAIATGKIKKQAPVAQLDRALASEFDPAEIALQMPDAPTGALTRMDTSFPGGLLNIFEWTHAY